MHDFLQRPCHAMVCTRGNRGTQATPVHSRYCASFAPQAHLHDVAEAMVVVLLLGLQVRCALARCLHGGHALRLARPAPAALAIPARPRRRPSSHRWGGRAVVAAAVAHLWALCSSRCTRCSCILGSTSTPGTRRWELRPSLLRCSRRCCSLPSRKLPRVACIASPGRSALLHGCPHAHVVHHAGWTGCTPWHHVHGESTRHGHGLRWHAWVLAPPRPSMHALGECLLHVLHGLRMGLHLCLVGPHVSAPWPCCCCGRCCTTTKGCQELVGRHALPSSSATPLRLLPNATATSGACCSACG